MPVIIIPPRKLAGSLDGSGGVLSLNGLRGDLTLDAGFGTQITISGNTVTIGVVAGEFVLRGGDTFLGNLNFTPNAGFYGLRVARFTATALSTLTGDVGGLVWDSTNSVLKFWYSGAWMPVVPTDVLTLSEGDARYLQLTGGTMSGPIRMGTSVFRIGSLSSDPVSAVSGDLYINSISGEVRIYTSGSWQNIGISSITAGAGLTGGVITSSGTIAVDTSYVFDWLSNHTFESVVTFNSTIAFDPAHLTLTGESVGDILYRDSGSWQLLPIGSTGQILTVSGGIPQWEDNNAGEIGTPTGGVYGTGFFPLDPTTTIADAMNEINELLLRAVPGKPASLTGLALTTTANPTGLSTVILSAGLPTGWYTPTIVAGNTITTYFISGSYSLDSPSTSTTFYCGDGNTPATYGTLLHKKYTTNGSTFTPSTVTSVNLTTGSTGTTGTVDVLDFSPYPSPSQPTWEKANARIIYTQSADGYEGQTLSHALAGESNKSEWWLDTYSASNPNPSFSTSPTMAEVVPVDKWLSGVLYYGATSSFTASFIAAAGIFNRCYNSSQVSRISGAGMNNLNSSPATTPTYTSIWDRTSGGAEGVVNFSLNASNQVNFNRYLTVTLYKASGTTVAQNGTIGRLIDTYASNLSTTTSEFFHDEVYRLVLNTTTAWTSTAPLVNGNAQVRAGTLQYPIAADYSNNPSPYNYTLTLSGDQEYQRFFFKTSASNGTLTFVGLSNVLTQISPYGTGHLNVLIYTPYDSTGTLNDQFYDLAVTVGANSNNGTTRSLAMGGRASGSSGSALNWSIGTNTTGVGGVRNNAQFRVIVIFRDNTNSITSMVST